MSWRGGRSRGRRREEEREAGGGTGAGSGGELSCSSRNTLPQDIFVVVYEDRCDLMQAVIKGPQVLLSANRAPPPSPSPSPSLPPLHLSSLPPSPPFSSFPCFLPLLLPLSASSRRGFSPHLTPVVQGTPYADGLFFFDIQLPPGESRLERKRRRGGMRGSGAGADERFGSRGG
eukprot:755379-Hanusia_phi.AAC.5